MTAIAVLARDRRKRWALVMPREVREVRVALLHEGVPTLLGFVGHVPESGGFAGE